MNYYPELKKKMGEVADLKGAIGLMHWDQEVMMPRGSISLRSRQLATLSALQHELHVIECRKLLDQISPGEEAQLPLEEQENLHEIRRMMEKTSKLPTEYVRSLQMETSRAQHSWEQARKANDFSLFEPSLSKLAELKLQEAEYLGYSENPYDAFIDVFEPGMTASRLEPLFAGLRQQLLPLLKAIADAPQVDDSFLKVNIEPARQLAFTERVLAKMGYDFTQGRQDRSTHPFTLGIGPMDVRITTRVTENDITEILYSSIHEGGHALYEQGLRMEHYGLPYCEYCSIGIHESQSRVWENNVGRSLEFWQYWFEDFASLYPDGLKGKTPEDVFRAVNKVERSFIRTSADELTYHIHILLRFEIENLLINGKVKVKDLPELWNARMKEYLGLEVKSMNQGILQDIHWSHGSFGYFPTYSLGSLYAAQMMARAQEDLPGLPGQFRSGDFSTFRKWLKVNVHEKGRSKNPEKLCEIVTGKPLNVKNFIDYAVEKYGRVYGVTL